MYQQSPDIGSRLASAFLDHVTGLILKIVIWLPSFLSVLNSTVHSGPEQNPFSLFIRPEFCFTYIGIASFYYMKDVFNGRSVGKRATGLQVVNNKTGLPASPIRCVLRNFGFLLWIVEVILVLASPSRRLGDFIGGTKVISTSKPVQMNFPFYQHFCAILLAFTISAMMYSPFFLLGSVAETAVGNSPEFRSDKIVEKQETTEDLSAFFEKKYEKEFDSVVLSAQSDGNTTLITGSFILKKNLFSTGEIYELKSKIKADLLEKMAGKEFDADFTIVFLEGKDPIIEKVKVGSSG